jgi:hypothetical protein
MPYYMKVTSVAADGESKQLPLELPVAQVLSGDASSAATATTNGTVKQAANIAAVSVPFADLTAAANAHNALLAAMKTAGLMVAD